MTGISKRIERKVAVIDENKTALDAALIMTEKLIGSVVVTSSSEVKGIFTERDLMKCVIGEKRDPASVQLKEVVVPKIVTVDVNENVERCLELMKNNYTRHLLVYENNEFVGIISIRDIVMLMLEEKESFIAQLTKYITG